MKVSVIIPTYNNIKLTKKCLEALSTTHDIETIVVDNASTDNTRKFLKQLKDINLILNKENLGFSKANNIGAGEAKGDILVFLNNDTEVQKGWLEVILEIFKKEKNVGAVGVKLLFPDKTIQHAGLAFYPDRIPRHLYYQSKKDASYANKTREFQAVTAACVAIPKKVFFEVGGFDEAYINGLEDVDLCLKIKEKGYRIFYQPKSVVVHHESVSPGRFNHSKHNADIFMSKWKNKIKPDSHQILKEDGFNWFQILMFDLKSMSYGPNEYGTRPIRVKVLRLAFIPLQKVYTLTRLVLSGDFREIASRTKEKLS